MFPISDFPSPLPSGARVLDLGCGTGRHVIALAAAGFCVTGVDMDADAVETARGLAAGLPVAPGFLAARAESLPFPDGSFDAVLCVDVLHWSADAAAFERMWNEAWRVLGRGGGFAVRTLLGDYHAPALPLGGGRFRLASGAEWFLPSRADLEARVAQARGIWLESPRDDGEGAGRFLIQKP